MARTPEEEERRRRRRRLVRGLLAGGAAIGLPALANAILARRALRLQAPAWGDPESYASKWGRVVFRRLGRGHPLVLLHSLGPGHSGAQWRRAAELLARGRQVLVLDLLGCGESERPALDYSGALYVEIILDFIEAIVGHPADLCGAGHSAAYALQVVADAPDRVRGVGLVAPRGLSLRGEVAGLKDTVPQRFLRFPVLGTSAVNVLTRRRALERHLKNNVYYDPNQVTDELVESHYRSCHLPGSTRHLRAYFAGRLDHRVEPALKEIKAPVWIGWGRETRSPAVETADLWLRALPEAELEVFAAASRLPHAEVPELFCAAFASFLERL